MELNKMLKQKTETLFFKKRTR